MHFVLLLRRGVRMRPQGHHGTVELGFVEDVAVDEVRPEILYLALCWIQRSRLLYSAP